MVTTAFNPQELGKNDELRVCEKFLKIIIDNAIESVIVYKSCPLDSVFCQSAKGSAL